ncbi:MAG: hypothetical protein ACI865_001361 [Flavobacteriaceae bacterium]|jgi:hypothetical protein
MKTFLLIFSLLAGSYTFSQSSTNPGEYMDYFSIEYLQIQKDMWDYTRSVSHGRSARKVDKRRGELIQSVSSALGKAKRAKGFKDETQYRDSIILYFDLIGKVLREDYAEIVDMEAISEQSYDAMEAYMTARDMASDKLAEAGDMLSREHKAFAKLNDVTIIESDDTKLDMKMDVAGQVYDHYNEVYLVFFKSYKQEAYLLEAVGQKDVSAIEQNRNALLETVEEGIVKLAGIKKYEGDPLMLTATRQLLTFYQDEAENDIKLLFEYLEITENFAAIKSAFDAKKPKSRTQEDVDAYNNGVNDVNEATNDYNEVNEASNERRNRLIDQWNKNAEKFTTKHVPRGK